MYVMYGNLFLISQTALRIWYNISQWTAFKRTLSLMLAGNISEAF